MLDGRVKTLHPMVHGGLLARRDMPAHMQALTDHGIATIDLLVVNLYPFEATVAKPGCTLEDAIENIDIGGPAMVRSAAKNWKDVTVLTDASQYAGVLEELQATRHGVRDHAFRAVGGCLQPHQPIRRRHQRLPVAHRARRQPRGVSRPDQRPLRQAAGPALWREPAQAGGVLPRSVSRAGLARQRRSVAGQGTELQQHRRRGCGLGMRQELRAERLRHRQTRQPLWRGDRRRPPAGVRQGLPDRSHIGFRRHHRVQRARWTERWRRR